MSAMEIQKPDISVETEAESESNSFSSLATPRQSLISAIVQSRMQDYRSGFVGAQIASMTSDSLYGSAWLDTGQVDLPIGSVVPAVDAVKSKFPN